jgi:hypothetical protein
MNRITRHPGTLDLTLATLVVTLLGTSGCRAIEGIFKAGVWVGIVGLVILLAVVFGIARHVTSPR